MLTYGASFTKMMLI